MRKLRLLKIKASEIDGYDDIESSHFAVASKVARGLCDVGIGTERTALQVKEIDFIPMQVESYQLVIPSGGKWHHLDGKITADIEAGQIPQRNSAYQLLRHTDMGTS